MNISLWQKRVESFSSSRVGIKDMNGRGRRRSSEQNASDQFIVRRQAIADDKPRARACQATAGNSQKHLDRISCLEDNRERLAEFTGMTVDRLQLRSGLVTEKLVPMQFGGKAREMLYLVIDYELLEEALPNR